MRTEHPKTAVARALSVAVAAATAALLAACSVPGAAPSRSASAASPAASASVDGMRALSDRAIGTAPLAGTMGQRVGTVTVYQGGRLTLSDFSLGDVPPGTTLRLSAATVGTPCPDDAYAFDVGPAGEGLHWPLPADLTPRDDPTFWRSALLVAPAADPAAREPGECLIDVVASGALEWGVAPAGVSSRIADGGARTAARGTVTVVDGRPVSYTAAAGDTAIAVAARLGVTVDDLHWLNPMEFALRAGMPINLDPDRRALPPLTGS